MTSAGMPLLERFTAQPRIAYFSMEIALRAEMPTYSGGLGVLAGDTVHSAADLGLPLSLIYCDGADMLAERVTAMRTANIYEPHVYCHAISATRVLGREADGWRARGNFTIVRTMADGDACLFASGRYFDHIVEVDGALRYRERVAVIDSRRIDTLLVIPI